MLPGPTSPFIFLGLHCSFFPSPCPVSCAQWSGQCAPPLPQDLIEALVSLQATAEQQGKRLGELEDYLDTLLIRVMEAAPVLLQKDSMIAKPSRQ